MQLSPLTPSQSQSQVATHRQSVPLGVESHLEAYDQMYDSD
jgi:hypothetical protein